MTPLATRLFEAFEAATKATRKDMLDNGLDPAAFDHQVDTFCSERGTPTMLWENMADAYIAALPDV